MLDIAEELNRWVEQGREFAVATVVAVGGSAPRQPGAALAVDRAGAAIGSVSGGCVEGAVYDMCREAMESRSTILERFGFSDEDAFAVGLTCGGMIDILITPVGLDAPSREVYAAALAAAAQGTPAAVARLTDGPGDLMGRALHIRTDGSYDGTLGGHPELDRTAAAEARALLDCGRTGTVAIGEDGSRCGRPLTLLIESSVSPPRMIVFGAIDFASALARIGKFIGYHVTVCDARPVFATAGRFPDADEIVIDWPHRYLASAASTAGPCSACSLMTPSSTSRSSNSRSPSRSPTSERWARAVPTSTGTHGCARPASPNRNWPGCVRPSVSTSGRGRRRRPHCRSARRSSPTGGAAPAPPSPGRTLPFTTRRRPIRPDGSGPSPDAEGPAVRARQTGTDVRHGDLERGRLVPAAGSGVARLARPPIRR